MSRSLFFFFRGSIDRGMLRASDYRLQHTVSPHEKDTVAEWLRRQIRNLLEFLRVGSSPAGVDSFVVVAFVFLLLLSSMSWLASNLCFLLRLLRALVVCLSCVAFVFNSDSCAAFWFLLAAG